jgi:hypothetical protein
MLTEYATSADFTRWQQHAAGLDSWSIKYIVEDCRKAALAMENHNVIREGYYIDQKLTYLSELLKRNASLPAGLRHRV